jgi:hypothetical protein
MAEGAIRCLNDLGASAIATHCHEYGEPLGYPLLTGGPLLVIGAVLMYLPGVESYGAYTLAASFFDALALAGGYLLLRRLDAPRWLALGAATAYLLAPTVIGMRSFGGTYFGFALLPAYAWVDLLVISAIGGVQRGRVLVAVFAGYAALRGGALFMDGYSFVASALVGGFLWAEWLLRRGISGYRRVIGMAVALAANAVAVGIYLAYVPGDYSDPPLEIFRAMGLDVITLVSPSEWVWAAAELGYGADHRGLWGDGSNAAYNYAGVVVAALAGAYLLLRPRRREALALAAAGVVALVLSLGPSLKIDDARPDVASQPGYEYYLMPADEATIDLPWASLFTALPGIDSMRATYRWYGATRMALIVLAALALAALAARGGRYRALAIAIALVAIIEIAPNLASLKDLYARSHDDVAAVRADVEPSLREVTRPGERTFFASYDGTHNDYMVNFLSAGAGLKAYNAGGDKNVTMAAAVWPDEIKTLAVAPLDPDAVVVALESGRADVIVLPFFHARWSSYAWPPTEDVRADARAAFAPVLADPRLNVERERWLATVRLDTRRGQR